jgi:hypothetical protein
LTKWLNPTVNVLYALSATLGEGVGLVRLGTSTCLHSTLIFICQVISPAKVIFAGVGVLLLVRILLSIRAGCCNKPLRQLWMFARARTI